MRGAAIFNIASTAGLGASASFGAYTATKHGLVGLSKTIATEFGRDGNRCNAVCLGFVRTEMHLGATPPACGPGGHRRGGQWRRAATLRYRSAVPASPTRLPGSVVFLAGPGGAYITGTAIPVAGGNPVGL